MILEEEAMHELIQLSFTWMYSEEGQKYWDGVYFCSLEILHQRRREMAKKKIVEEKKPAFVNDPGVIVVPEYEEAKWMEGARYEYMIKARDGLLTAFEWAKTKQGVDYWKTCYTKLFIMCKHMEVCMVLKRLG